MLKESSQKDPEATALYYKSEAISYGQLQQRVHYLAANMAKLGISSGDRIGIWLSNVPEWIESFFACAYLGATAVSLNTRFGASEVGDILGRAGCKALLLASNENDKSFISILDQVSKDQKQTLKLLIIVGRTTDKLDKIPNTQVCHYQDLLEKASPTPLVGTPSSNCIMFTTSGTTKLPKLVLHSQKNISVHSKHVARSLNLKRSSSTVLQAIPFCGVFGFSQAMAAFSSGASVVCVPSFDVAGTLKLIQTQKVTHLNGSDEMFDRLIKGSDGPEAFKSIKFCGYANFTPSLPDIVERADKWGLKLVGLYGASELLAFLAVQQTLASSSDRSRMGGFPVDKKTKVRVRNPESGQLMRRGETGELEFLSTTLMDGYYKNSKATNTVMTDDGFFKSGDLGRLRKDGSFEYLSRMGDVLRLGGFLVNPEEIETFIQSHPKVLGCQVIGINGPEKPSCAAFVTSHTGVKIDEQEILLFCQTSLAKYKVPRHVFFLTKFPTISGPNGTKIQKNALRSLAEENIRSRLV